MDDNKKLPPFSRVKSHTMYATVGDYLRDHSLCFKESQEAERIGYVKAYSRAIDDIRMLRRKGFHRAHEIANIMTVHYDTALLKFMSRHGLFNAPAIEINSWTEIRQAVLARDNFKCVLCSHAEDLEIDHILEVSKGGTPEITNLRVLCVGCHTKRYNSGKPA